jgi:hypothetical protein
VSVQRLAGGEVRAHVRPGALAALRDAEAVAAEVRSALAAGLAAFERQYFAARWQAFGSRLGSRLGEDPAAPAQDGDGQGGLGGSGAD